MRMAMKNIAAMILAMLGLGLLVQTKAADSSAASKEPFVVGNGNAVTGSLVGGEYTGPPKPAPRDADGRPDLTGYWKPLVEKGKPRGNIGKDLPGFRLPLTPAGEVALKNNLTRVVDPESRCIYGGIPRHDASGIPFQILQTSQQVGFLYYLGYRLVPVGGAGHEPDPDPTYYGNAQGRWEADTFVVDVIGLKDSKDGNLWIDENGNPESARTHIVERWTRPDYHHIQLALTIDDPVYYQHPFTFNRTWVRGLPGEKLNEYACNENNVDLPHLGPGPGTIGQDGNRGSLYDHKPLPVVPPGPEAYGK
jgi:hypothetical protein